jgi:hypothetical protein
MAMPKPTKSPNDWRTMQGMVRSGPSLTKALEKEHREELAREDERLEGSDGRVRNRDVSTESRLDK